MLTEFFVDGYKTLQNLTVPLEPVTVIVGPNNSGKSNFIGALELFADAVRQRSLGRALELRGGLTKVSTRGGTITLRLRAKLELDGCVCELSLDSNDEETLQINGPSIAARVTRLPRTVGGNTNTQIRGTVVDVSISSDQSVLDAASGSSHAHATVRALDAFVSGLFVCDLAPNELRRHSLITNTATLGRQGQEIAAVLDRLQGERPLVRRSIDQELQRVMPSVDAVTTIPSPEKGKKVIGIAEGNAVYSAEHVSDGILLFIGMTTAAQMAGGRTILALEEPDKGVHPRRIRELLDQVLRVNRQGTQFVITTHSPILLSEFRDSPEAVLLFDRDGDGPTRVTRLSDLPTAAQATDVSLGELWYSGLLGGVPTP